MKYQIFLWRGEWAITPPGGNTSQAKWSDSRDGAIQIAEEIPDCEEIDVFDDRGKFEYSLCKKWVKTMAYSGGQ